MTRDGTSRYSSRGSYLMRRSVDNCFGRVGRALGMALLSSLELVTIPTRVESAHTTWQQLYRLSSASERVVSDDVVRAKCASFSVLEAQSRLQRAVTAVLHHTAPLSFLSYRAHFSSYRHIIMKYECKGVQV